MASSCERTAFSDFSPIRKDRNLISSLYKLLSSDRGYEYLQVSKLFAIAYAPSLLALVLLCLSAVPLCMEGGLPAFMHGVAYMKPSASLLALSMASIVALYTVMWAKQLIARACYLVDFASFKPADEHKLSTEHCDYVVRASRKFTHKSSLFQLKILMKSGLGEETYGPAFLFNTHTEGLPSFASALEETCQMMFGAVDDLIAKTGLDPVQIDVLIVHVCLFYPAPSLASHVVNRYRMRQDVRSFNISGMGCAAGMVAVDMSKDLLKVHKNKLILIVGTENITSNWYYGNDKSMLVPNCIFRCGSYALLLSNRKQDRQRAKFELCQSIRTTTSASQKSYDAIVHREDDAGNVGTSLSAKLLDVASEALGMAIMKLMPQYMPFSELLRACVTMVEKNVMGMEVEPYMPDFKRAFDHFLIHPGGRAVIDGIGRTLRLSDYDLEPSRMALHRFGNTSSSGLWYALAYCEAKQRVKKGHKLWQVALGSGFKCNSVVWKVLRDIEPTDGHNPWLDCIHRYPVEILQNITPAHPYYYLLKKMEEEAESPSWTGI